MSEIVEREWTPIGSEGFEYFWDPDDTEFGGPYIYWLKGSHTARCAVDTATLVHPDSLAYLIQRRTWDVEASYRRMLREGEIS
jgi:hypothetical protein